MRAPLRDVTGDDPVPDAGALDEADNGPILCPVAQIAPGGAAAQHEQPVRPQARFYGPGISTVDGIRGEMLDGGLKRATPQRAQNYAYCGVPAIVISLLPYVSE